MRTVLAALCAVLVLGTAAGAPLPAGAAPSSAEAASTAVMLSLDGDLSVTDTDGRALAEVEDRSSGEVVLRSATTADGLPVIVSGVTAARDADAVPAGLADLQVGSAATPEAVVLAWTAVAGARTYAVYRDDALVASTAEARFVDTEVSPGSVHRYTVEAAVELDPEPVVDPRTGETVRPDRWTGYGWHIPVAVPADDVRLVASATDAFEASTTAAATSSFTYKTFIAEPDAPGFPCVLFPTDTYFGGDDRTWVSGAGGSFRTRMTATADWASETLSTSRDVGDTVNYNADGTVRETRTASMTGMGFGSVSVTATRASFMIDHSASNPFCASTGGEIRYNIAVSVYRSGVYLTHGWRRPVPHHEAYVRHDSDAWHTVLRRTNDGFHCLTGVCGTDALNTIGNW